MHVSWSCCPQYRPCPGRWWHGPVSRVQMVWTADENRDDSHEGRKRMRTWREILLTATVVVAVGAAAPAIAQDATVHGHVQNPAGQPITTGTVQFSHDMTGGEWKGKKIEN